MASSRPLHQRRLGNANVVYLTLSMRLGVRILSVCLVASLTVVAAFPPCCWSMADADHHLARSESSTSNVRVDEHHHHGAAEATLPASTTVRDAQACNADITVMIATTGPSFSMCELRATGASIPIFEVPASHTPFVSFSDLAPPGASPGAAFLNPLRI